MRGSPDFIMPRLSNLQTKFSEVVTLHKMSNVVVVLYLKSQKERKRFEGVIQAVDMTANSNYYPIHNYHFDSRHEEGNYYVPQGDRYSTVDSVNN